MRWWAWLTRWRRPDPEVTRAMLAARAQLEVDRARRPEVERLARQMRARGVDSLAELIDQALGGGPEPRR